MDDIAKLHQQRNWIEEVQITERIWSQLDKPSLRELGKYIGKSKSWVDKSLKLAKGLKVYPYLKDQDTRHGAYTYLMNRKKK